MSAEDVPVCPAQFEPVPTNQRNGTHTCCRIAGHEGSHACPICRAVWDRPRTDTKPEEGQR